ncbi:hypothetical protein A2U01_0051463, partial [Trifolium medium]|nr:hypothetical protein [Trifolium medium]
IPDYNHLPHPSLASVPLSHSSTSVSLSGVFSTPAFTTVSDSPSPSLRGGFTFNCTP